MNKVINAGSVRIALCIMFATSMLMLSSCKSGDSPTSLFDSGSGSNRIPSANAGLDQNISTGSVSLDGSASSDPDGDLLSFTWTFLSRPGGSTAALSSRYAIRPVFIADKEGSYVIQLVVNDGQANSAADTVTVTATAVKGNSAPIANAGPDQAVKTGMLVTLTGASSVDIDGDPLTYAWSMTTKPGTSAAELSSTIASAPTFTADKDGSYIVQLVVNDGHVNSVADSMVVNASTPVLVRVPDTGQTADYTASPGEDSDYTFHPPSYADNGNGTVTDAVTGLMWQQQDDGTKRDWATAMSYCDGLTLGGHADWRLPDNKELFGIINYGTNVPMIDATFFPNTQAATYWSSTEYGLNPSSAWNAMFDTGLKDVNRTDKAKLHYVRCIRGTQSIPVLTDNGNGTITDETTSLIWQQMDDNVQRKWTEVLTYCEGLDLAGQTDWRLPNVKELLSIVDYRFWPHTLDESYFASTSTTLSVPTYWSSTTLPSNTNQGLGVKFGVGSVTNPGKSFQWYVRCVRGGQ